jgi:hypothetical protein
VPGGHGFRRFARCAQVFQRVVDLAGKRLGVQLVEVTLDGAREEFRPAQAEVMGTARGTLERLVRYRYCRLHALSITRYNHLVLKNLAGGDVLPLDGITVVSLEQAVAAPLATRHLADLGARVIKVV